MAYESLEVFRTLDIRGAGDVLEELCDSLDAVLPKPRWRRDQTKEASMRAALDGDKGVWVFDRAPDDVAPTASLSLLKRGNEVSLANIVPQAYGQLSIAQYNSILEDFLSSGVRQRAQDAGVSLVASSPARSITDWLSEAAAKKLRVFSAAANKSTGASHPKDNERWIDFIVTAFRDGSKLDSALFRRFLIEVDHWPDEQADDLAADYGFAFDVLKKFTSTGA